MADSDSDDHCMMIDNDFDDEASDDFYGSSDEEENVKPKKKTVVTTTKAAPKKSNTKTTTMKVAKISTTKSKADRVLTSKDNTTVRTSHVTTTTSRKSITAQREKTVEEKYQKKSQIEHILLRPDTYSTCEFPVSSVYQLASTNDFPITNKNIYFSPSTVSWIDTTLNHQYVRFERKQSHCGT